MKKVLALVLSVMMVLSLSVVAFAAEVAATGTPGQVEKPGDPDNNLDKGVIIGTGDKDSNADADPDKPGATYYYTIFRETPNNVAGDVAVDGTNYEMLDDDEYAKHLTVSIRESGDKMIDSYAIVRSEERRVGKECLFWC